MLRESRVIRGLLRNGEARFFLCDTTGIAQHARDIHTASNTCTAALGRMLSACAMLGVTLKDEQEKIALTINGNGPAGTVTAVAGANGILKITIQHPEIELPLKSNGALNVGGVLGKEGQLTVIRSYKTGEPYTGRVRLVSGEVAEDMAMYFLESEQIPSVCALGTHVRERVESSGGIFIHAMPSCSEALLQELEIRTELFSGISQMIKDMPLEEIASAAFRSLEPVVLEKQELHLQCDCSRDKIERVLLSLGEKELRSIIDQDETCEVCCPYCRTAYQFNKQQLECLLSEGMN